jgi:hypothetical protein
VKQIMLSASLLTAIEKVAGALRSEGAKWLLGGSCGLLLRGIPIQRNPRDLDFYFDADSEIMVYHALHGYAIDKPQYSQTDIYESTLSHYQLENIIVEGVGSFRVIAMESHYTVETAYMDKHFPFYEHIGNERIPLIPLAHELVFNILRKRPDRFEPIAAAMLADPQTHLPALQNLLSRNRLGQEALAQVEKLLGQTLFRHHYE